MRDVRPRLLISEPIQPVELDRYFPVPPLVSLEPLEPELLPEDFLDLVPASPPPPYPMSEPAPVLLEPVPIVEPLPLVPDELLPVVPGVLVLPLPVVPPLVEPPDWAKAAPAASIETTANRFNHVFRMRKRSR